MKRQFPAYTTAQLKSFVEEGVAENMQAIIAEIKAREAGLSVVSKTPQVAW